MRLCYFFSEQRRLGTATMQYRISGYVICLVFISLWGVNSTAVAEGSSSTVREEIIVTAQKRQESLQDVSIAVTALDADVLRQDGVACLDDVGDRVPNLVFFILFECST